MRIIVVADSHMFRTPDNHFWCKGITGNSFFMRYAAVFEEVYIVCRVKNVADVDPKQYLQADSEKIQVFPMPFARGAKEYLLHLGAFIRASIKASALGDCAIFRVPSVLSFLVVHEFKKRKKPYALEIVADPESSESIISHVVFTRILKRLALQANGVSYVTQSFLQNKYPCHVHVYGQSKEYFESNYSSLDLYPDYIGEPKTYSNDKQKFLITHTANKLSSNTKGQDVLIRALGDLVAKGWDIKIRFVGDSGIKEQLYKLAKLCKVEDRISFTGLLPEPREVRAALIDSDLFVFPTKSEGLPRAIIEAMAVGLPCISTPVGGIPELLDPEYLVEQSDIAALVQKIEYLLNHKPLLERASKNNIERSKEYLYDKLSCKRNIFYQKLYNLSEETNEAPILRNCIR